MNQQYKDAIKKLNNCATFYQKDKKYLLLFKIQQETLIFRIYNGNYIWIQEIDDNYLDAMKKKLEIKGNYTSICEMILQSIEDNSFILEQNQDNLIVEFQFKINSDVFLKGQIPMGGGLQITNEEETKQISMQFTIDLYEAMREKLKIARTKQQENNNKKTSPLPIQLQEIQEQEEIKSKRKINASMIMPNHKKRKAMGAKLQ